MLRGTTNQNGKKWTKMASKIPNGEKYIIMVMKIPIGHDIHQNLPSKILPKYTKIGIFV
jgi:hypothetical protein